MPETKKTKKPATKKPAAKKTTTKKPAAKKEPAKKAATKKAAPKHVLKVIIGNEEHALEFASQAKLEAAKKAVEEREWIIGARRGDTRMLPTLHIETKKETVSVMKIALVK